MRKISIISLFVLHVFSLNALDWNLSHKLTASGRLFEKSSRQTYNLNANYKPDVFLTIFGNEKFSIDTEQSLEFDYGNYKSDIDEKDDFDLSLYRSWLRFSANQYEVRFGRQKINFGTAQILRPLKWFDTIDPTDPQKNSEGVDALLFRYYFLNNANLWLWAIDPENTSTTYYDSNPQIDGYEFGGRIQYPFKYCEAAFSYHHRDFDVDIEDLIQYDNEDRFGFDCRWDFQIGLWIETMYSALSNSDSTFYSHLFTIGADYTLGIGNGLYVLTEHMFYENTIDDFPTLFEESSASSMMLSYPVNLLDSVSAIINYDWISDNFFYYASYARSYDYISVYLNFFWNPKYDNYPVSIYKEDGRSVQLLMELNF